MTRFWSSMKPDFSSGQGSCGVARQYTGSAGKITNCLIGVFACYVSRQGHTFIDRSLYVPKGWTDDAARMKAAHVPEKTAFATKPALAVGMIERAFATAMPLPLSPPIASRRCRHRRGASAGWQGLCSWRRFQSQRQLLGQDQAHRGRGGTRRRAWRL